MRRQRFLTIINEAHVARRGMCFNLNNGINSNLNLQNSKLTIHRPFHSHRQTGTEVAFILFPDTGNHSKQVWAPSLSLLLLLSLLLQSLPLHYSPARRRLCAISSRPTTETAAQKLQVAGSQNHSPSPVANPAGSPSLMAPCLPCEISPSRLSQVAV